MGEDPEHDQLTVPLLSAAAEKQGARSPLSVPLDDAGTGSNSGSLNRSGEGRTLQGWGPVAPVQAAGKGLLTPDNVDLLSPSLLRVEDKDFGAFVASSDEEGRRQRGDRGKRKASRGAASGASDPERDPGPAVALTPLDSIARVESFFTTPTAGRSRGGSASRKGSRSSLCNASSASGNLRSFSISGHGKLSRSGSRTSSTASGTLLQGDWTTASGQVVNVDGDIVRFTTADGKPILPARVLEIDKADGGIKLLDAKMEYADEFEVRWSDGDVWSAQEQGTPHAVHEMFSSFHQPYYRGAGNESDRASPDDPTEVLADPAGSSHLDASDPDVNGSHHAASPMLDLAASPPHLPHEPPTKRFTWLSPPVVRKRGMFSRLFCCVHDATTFNAPMALDVRLPLDCTAPRVAPLVLKARNVLHHLTRGMTEANASQDLRELAISVCVSLGRVDPTSSMPCGYRLDVMIAACGDIAGLKRLKQILQELREHHPMLDPALPGLCHGKVRLVATWWSMDKDGDGSLDFDEIQCLMSKLNIRIKESELRHKLLLFDDDRNRRLDFCEFVNFFKYLQERQELGLPLRQINDPSRGTTMHEKTKHFLQSKQRQAITSDEVSEILRNWSSWSEEADSLATSWSLQEFSNYITSAEANSWFSPGKRQAYMDMTQPLSHYFINSSHNTYITGSQHNSQSSVGMYKFAFKSGVKCIEVDCWSRGSTPIVTHGNTMVTQILFEDVVRTIAQYAFAASPYPVVISLENRVSDVAVQDQMAAILEQYLGKYIVYPSLDRASFSPDKLRRKVLLRSKADSAPSIRRLLALVSGKVSLNVKDVSHTVCPSCVESKAEQLSQKPEFKRLTRRQLVRVYPSGSRMYSSNYSACRLWSAGAQLAAMNIQTPDFPMRLNTAKFLENGNCGYVLKPPHLRGSGGKVHRRQLTLSVLSGGNIPKPHQAETGEIVNPYVEIIISGSPADSAGARTAHVSDNGFDPVWNEDFHFLIRDPACTFVTVRVMNYAMIRDPTFLGEATCPFACLREGYRCAPLRDRADAPILDAFVLLRIMMSDE